MLDFYIIKLPNHVEMLIMIFFGTVLFSQKPESSVNILIK